MFKSKFKSGFKNTSHKISKKVSHIIFVGIIFLAQVVSAQDSSKYFIQDALQSTFTLAFLPTAPYTGKVYRNPANTDQVFIDVLADRKNALPNRANVTELEFSWFYKASSPSRPLVILVPGFGGRFDTAVSAYLAEQLRVTQDYNVLSVLSPSDFYFIVYLSSRHFWGHTPTDSRELYQLLGRTVDSLRAQQKLQTSDIKLVGYSLGGLHGAYLASIDKAFRKINFSKISLINPPVDLLSSAAALDRIVPHAELSGLRAVQVIKKSQYIEDLMASFFKKDFNEQNIADYYIFKTGWPLIRQDMNRIAMSQFRDSLWDATLASRIIDLKSADTEAWKQAAVSEYHEIGKNILFSNYISQKIWNKLAQVEPGSTLEAVNQKLSLYPLANALAADQRVTAFHCENDFILGGQDLLNLKNWLSSRLSTIASCGHLGQVWFKPFQDQLYKNLQ